MQSHHSDKGTVPLNVLTSEAYLITLSLEISSTDLAVQYLYHCDVVACYKVGSLSLLGNRLIIVPPVLF